MVGQRDPLVPEITGGLGHLLRRAAAVGPVGVGVAVAAQRGPQRRPPRCGPLRLPHQPVEVGRPLAVRGLGDDLGGDRAYPGQRQQRLLGQPALQLAGRQVRHHPGGPAERPHPVGRRLRPFQLERDLTQRLDRVQLIPAFVKGRSGQCPVEGTASLSALVDPDTRDERPTYLYADGEASATPRRWEHARPFIALPLAAGAPGSTS